jgi:hypothetical protein
MVKFQNVRKYQARVLSLRFYLLFAVCFSIASPSFASWIDCEPVVNLKFMQDIKAEAKQLVALQKKYNQMKQRLCSTHKESCNRD